MENEDCQKGHHSIYSILKSDFQTPTTMFNPRQEDMIFINSPPSRKEVEQGWKKLSLMREEGHRKIYAFQLNKSSRSEQIMTD